MLLSFVLCAFAQEPAVDWAEYEAMTRKVCRVVATKEELGAVLYAQLTLMAQAQTALVSSQMQLAELRRQVHMSRVATDFAHEAESLAADAEITRSIRALQDEMDRVQARVSEMERDARVSSRSVTPRDFPRASLRRRCRASFSATRADMDRVLATLTREDEAVSRIPLHELFVLPPG